MAGSPCRNLSRSSRLGASEKPLGATAEENGTTKNTKSTKTALLVSQP
jgi:hypothetical protein